MRGEKRWDGARGWQLGLMAAAWVVTGCAADEGSMGFGGATSAGMPSDISAGPGPGGEGTEGPAAGQLTAGEWRDLNHWTDWLELLSPDGQGWDELVAGWGLETRARIEIVVEDDAGSPIVDAEVTLWEGETARWQSRTDNLGRAELFAPEGEGAADPAIAPSLYDVEVRTASGQGATLSGVDAIGEAWRVAVAGSVAPPEVALDLMLVVDTTGSMSDELSFLQSELADVMERVRADAGEGLHVRTSVNFYRDHGDEYVVRSHPFRDDLETSLVALRGESAAGGGDYQEAVEEALDAAIFDHEWSQSARARLLLLVLDAPPHETPAIAASLQASAAEAARLGIRIVPIASSGVDRTTEFLLRSLAILTGGTYTFLTNHSGIGGDHLEPTIGEYQVEPLNDLLVRLIVDAVVEVDAGPDLLAAP